MAAADAPAELRVGGWQDRQMVVVLALLFVLEAVKTRVSSWRKKFNRHKRLLLKVRQVECGVESVRGEKWVMWCMCLWQLSWHRRCP